MTIDNYLVVDDKSYRYLKRQLSVKTSIENRIVFFKLLLRVTTLAVDKKWFLTIIYFAGFETKPLSEFWYQRFKRQNDYSNMRREQALDCSLVWASMNCSMSKNKCKNLSFLSFHQFHIVHYQTTLVAIVAIQFLDFVVMSWRKTKYRLITLAFRCNLTNVVSLFIMRNP